MKKKIIIGVFLAIIVLIMMPVNSAVESNIVEDINKKDLITLIKDTRSNLKDLISSEKLEQRIKDIKDILVDIVVNSNLQDNNPERLHPEIDN